MADGTARAGARILVFGDEPRRGGRSNLKRLTIRVSYSRVMATLALKRPS